MTGKVHMSYHLNELYEKYGRSEPYVGTFFLGRPILVVNDMDAIRRILVGDFDHFQDRRHFDIGNDSSEANRIMANMVTLLRGERWRAARNALSPAYTSGKLKNMMPIFLKVRKFCFPSLEKSMDGSYSY